MTDLDERAALIERLSLMAMAEADTVAEMIEDNEDVGVIVEGRREAQFFASCAAEIARLSECATYEKARADKAVAQLEATQAEFREFDDTREAMARDYCALVDAIGVDMDAPPAVLDDVRRLGLSLDALNAAREEALALREALAKAHALTRLAAEKQELIEALELAEIADWTHSACDDHDMDVAAEACGSCFGYADAARVARRNALQMRGGEWVIADGTPKDEIAAIIRAALALPYDFNMWDRVALAMEDQQRRQAFLDEGGAIERKHHKDVAELVAALRREMIIGGHLVPVANLPYTLTSDAGHLMCEPYDAGLNGSVVPPFAACYWDTPEGRVFSLRSREGGADVSEIAKQYGGGGHRNAAGFRLPHGVSP